MLPLPHPQQGRYTKAEDRRGRRAASILGAPAARGRGGDMTAHIDAATLKAWLSAPQEIALLDVREVGQFGEGHLFFAVPLPYCRFELALPALVPNRAVRLVLCDGGDEAIAGRAAKRAEALGYRNVHILAGGTDAWKRAGYT